MMKIERSALVVHSAADMYQLVKDVPGYPGFLSWCTATLVHEQTDQMQTATLTVSVAGVIQRFTTNNALFVNERIDMQLLKGPFRSLQGAWSFVQLGEDGCKVSLKLDFEMRSGPVARVFGKGFGKVADRLLDDFCKRADEVHPNAY
jgi:ribosome-associated toxin RatA of RatAB toxin-antitoxin module